MRDPFKVVDILGSFLEHLIDHVPGMYLHDNEGRHDHAGQLAQLATNQTHQVCKLKGTDLSIANTQPYIHTHYECQRNLPITDTSGGVLCLEVNKSILLAHTHTYIYIRTWPNIFS